jgi:hypothetical protein
VARALGILNVLIGGTLFLCGAGTNIVDSIFPTFTTYATISLDARTLQETYERDRQERIEALRAQEKKAESEAARERIRSEVAAASSEHHDVKTVLDLPQINRHLTWVSRYLWIEVLSGVVLNLFLLCTGLGLILCEEWARKVAIVVAAVKIVRLILLDIFFTLVVFPHFAAAEKSIMATDLGSRLADHYMRSLFTRPGVPAGQPVPSPQEMVTSLVVTGNLFYLLGTLYPLASLIILTRPGVRAACLERAQDESEDS